MVVRPKGVVISSSRIADARYVFPRPHILADVHKLHLKYQIKQSARTKAHNVSILYSLSRPSVGGGKLAEEFGVAAAASMRCSPHAQASLA